MAQPGGTEGLHLHPWARRSLSPGGLQPWDYVLQPDRVPQALCPNCPRGGLLTHASAPSAVGIGIAVVPVHTHTEASMTTYYPLGAGSIKGKPLAGKGVVYCYDLQAWIVDGRIETCGIKGCQGCNRCMMAGESHPTDCPDCH